MAKPAWIDSHCHLTDPRWGSSLAASLAQAREKGVGRWIQGGISPEEWDRQLALKRHLGAEIVPVFGVHPWWVSDHSDAQVAVALAQLAERLDGAAGVGETGLDLHPRRLTPGSELRQRTAFEAQLSLAKSARKPLVLHLVRAEAPALEILRQQAPFPHGGMIHSFSGSVETARAYLDMGFLLSVGGSLTRPEAEPLRRAVAQVPADRLVLETDAPDQAPTLPGLDRRSRNEPVNLIGVAELTAQIRRTTMEEVLTQSTKNLIGLFSLE